MAVNHRQHDSQMLNLPSIKPNPEVLTENGLFDGSADLEGSDSFFMPPPSKRMYFPRCILIKAMEETCKKYSLGPTTGMVGQSTANFILFPNLSLFKLAASLLITYPPPKWNSELPSLPGDVGTTLTMWSYGLPPPPPALVPDIGSSIRTSYNREFPLFLYTKPLPNHKGVKW